MKKRLAMILDVAAVVLALPAGVLLIPTVLCWVASGRLDPKPREWVCLVCSHHCEVPAQMQGALACPNCAEEF